MPMVTAAPLVVVVVATGMAWSSVAYGVDDPEVTESSGLVWHQGRLITTNDSGDAGRLFVLDPDSGRTIRTVTWADGTSARRPVDVEALAPAGGNGVWVADIGDNDRERDSIAVFRVDLASGATEPYALTYPDGAHDAETLLRHPDTGQLYVVTKEPIGGVVYEVPQGQGREGPVELRRLGEVVGLATDGAFVDPHRIVIRNYGRAVVYSFPDLAPLGGFALPPQEQGEGLAVAPDGALWLSSEGDGAQLVRVALPEELTSATSPSPDDSVLTTPTTTSDSAPPSDGHAEPEPAMTGGAGELTAPIGLAATLLAFALGAWWWRRRAGSRGSAHST